MKKIDKYITNLPDLNGKKIIITGANSGIGFSTADTCLSKGAKVVLACRNMKRATAAKDNLQSKYQNSDVSILIYDQSQIKSCKQFIKDVFEEHPDFYCLFLNAGILKAEKGKLTDDGLPMTSGTNAYGAAAILDEFQKHAADINDEKRIVIQGSVAAKLSKYKNIQISTQNPNKNHFYQYNISKKICLNLFKYYSENNTNEYIKYLYCEPGISNTNITRNYPKWFMTIARPVMKLIFQDALEGSTPALDLICKSVPNGYSTMPRKIFGIRGLPKQSKINKKHLMLDEVPHILEIVNR